MAELLVRIVAKDPRDPDNPMKSQAGDVISVVDDGWPWSAKERANPAWRIVKAPGVDKALVSNLIHPKTNAVGEVVARRGFNLDLSTSDVGSKAEVALGNIQAATKARGTLGDVAAGDSINVIG